jgi:hypothetical protein
MTWTGGSSQLVTGGAGIKSEEDRAINAEMRKLTDQRIAARSKVSAPPPTPMHAR